MRKMPCMDLAHCSRAASSGAAACTLCAVTSRDAASGIACGDKVGRHHEMHAMSWPTSPVLFGFTFRHTPRTLLLEISTGDVFG